MMPTLSEKMWEKLYGNTPKSMESLNAPWHAFLGEEEENGKEDRGSVDDGSGNQNQLMRQREKTDSFADAKAAPELAEAEGRGRWQRQGAWTVWTVEIQVKIQKKTEAS